MERLRLAVVGVGHLGKEHARILSGLPDVDLVGVADVNAAQAEAVALRCGTQAFAAVEPLLDAVDAAVIAVPTQLHAAVAGDFLKRGVPLLVEKPLAPTPAEADYLADLAQRHGTFLQVGHIERFNPAYESLLRRPFRPLFIDCPRVGPFNGRSGDVGVVLDLMIHDLDLLLHLVGSPVREVEALGVSVFGAHEDMAQARLIFDNGCVARVAASRVHPEASRQAHLWGPEGYVCVDFARRQLRLTQPSESLRRHGLDPQRLSPTARAALPKELFATHLPTLELDCHPGQGDQLTRELQEFVDCVRTGASPRVTGADGARAVAVAHRILEAILRHSWSGRADGPMGPHDLPTPLGALFQSADREAA
jgi:predicted dehydrogenase